VGALGVAVPEPTTTVGGAAVVGGAALLGGAAALAARDELAAEEEEAILRDFEEEFVVTEIDVPETREPVFGEEATVPETREPVFGEEQTVPQTREPVFGEEQTVPETREPVFGEEITAPETQEPVSGPEITAEAVSIGQPAPMIRREDEELFDTPSLPTIEELTPTRDIARERDVLEPVVTVGSAAVDEAIEEATRTTEAGFEDTFELGQRDIDSAIGPQLDIDTGIESGLESAVDLEALVDTVPDVQLESLPELAQPTIETPAFETPASLETATPTETVVETPTTPVTATPTQTVTQTQPRVRRPRFPDADLAMEDEDPVEEEELFGVQTIEAELDPVDIDEI
jgi:hypothetical protein